MGRYQERRYLVELVCAALPEGTSPAQGLVRAEALYASGGRLEVLAEIGRV